jgi:hypothetical protein
MSPSIIGSSWQSYMQRVGSVIISMCLASTFNHVWRLNLWMLKRFSNPSRCRLKWDFFRSSMFHVIFYRYRPSFTFITMRYVSFLIAYWVWNKQKVKIKFMDWHLKVLNIYEKLINLTCGRCEKSSYLR